MEQINLKAIKINGNTISYSFSTSKELEKYFSGDDLIIEYPTTIDSVPLSVLVIPFVASVLPIIMLTNSELHLSEIDEDFFNCVPELAKGYETMFPESKFLGKIVANKIVHNKINENSNKVAMFYSGGLDSVQTLISHYEEKPDLISIWGSDINYNNDEGWKTLYNTLASEAQKMNLPIYAIRSSFRCFDNEGILDKDFSKQLKDGWWHGVKHGIALIGHVAPLAYLYNYKVIYIAASYSKKDVGVRCASDPATDNKVKFCGSKIYHDGFEYTRQDKVHNIVTYCEKKNIPISLHVCWKTQTGGNCCICEKCCRTILSLMVENANPKEYGFDNIEKFYKIFNHNELLTNIYGHRYLQIPINDSALRFKENKRALKKTPYWKYVKWLQKLDLNKPSTFKPSKFYLFKNKIKVVIDKVKRKITKTLRFLKYYIRFVQHNNKRTIVLLGTPSHSNIGDLAITYAEKKIIGECGYVTYEITCNETKYYFRLLKTLLKNKTVVLQGGGNMGDVWFNEELLRREILTKIPASKFVIMPQTIYYSNTDEGVTKEKESISFYNKNNVYMFLRDETSFAKARTLYPNSKTFLSTDIVLSLNKSIVNQKRNGKILLIFRKDAEKSLDDAIIQDIKNLLEQNMLGYDETDMYSCEKVTKENSGMIVGKKLKEISKYSLVITDRLHGMIFSTITSTPCIAFNNNNKKVEGTYQFIKNQGYIYLCKDYDGFINAFNTKFYEKTYKYDNSLLKDYYDKIKSVILEK